MIKDKSNFVLEGSGTIRGGYVGVEIQGVNAHSNQVTGITINAGAAQVVITNGAQKYGGSFMMVGRKDLPEEDRKALTKFVLSLKK